jgi:tetratricopeptide (TPR) repeat protein
MKPSRKIPQKISPKSRKYLLLFALIAIVAIAAVFMVLTRPAPMVIASDKNATFQSAGALYTKSVDLANAGDYQQALDTANQALALNVSSLTPLIQANRAGILVMLGDNADALSAADVAIAAEGNLTATHSIAWFNKGNALRNLGRIDEARVAYANATALDPTLQPPKI